MQIAGIFQANAGSNGPDQPTNMDSPIKVNLHVFQCKVDQSAGAIYTGQIMRVYDDKFSNGAAQVAYMPT